MWFRQAQLFQLSNKIIFSPESLNKNLKQFLFSPCLPSMPQSIGWVSPHTFDEDNTLFRAINDRVMLCLQFEEKILPSGVIKQHLIEKIKEIELNSGRKVRFAEKNSLKDEIVMTLLPRAFSRINRIYGYIDLKQQQLIIGSAQTKQVAQFVNFFQKAFSNQLKPVQLDGLAAQMTSWLKSQDYPSTLAIEKSCVLQDPDQTSRTIRCQQQDLSVEAVQAFLATGCQSKQLRLTWQDQVTFTLVDPFLLQSIKFQDEIIARAKEMDAESAEQQFDADFFIMSEIISQLFAELIDICNAKLISIPEKIAEVA